MKDRDKLAAEAAMARRLDGELRREQGWQPVWGRAVRDGCGVLAAQD